MLSVPALSLYTIQIAAFLFWDEVRGIEWLGFSTFVLQGGTYQTCSFMSSELQSDSGVLNWEGLRRGLNLGGFLVLFGDWENSSTSGLSLPNSWTQGDLNASVTLSRLYTLSRIFLFLLFLGKGGMPTGELPVLDSFRSSLWLFLRYSRNCWGVTETEARVSMLCLMAVRSCLVFFQRRLIQLSYRFMMRPNVYSQSGLILCSDQRIQFLICLFIYETNSQDFFIILIVNISSGVNEFSIFQAGFSQSTNTLFLERLLLLECSFPQLLWLLLDESFLYLLDILRLLLLLRYLVTLVSCSSSFSTGTTTTFFSSGTEGIKFYSVMLIEPLQFLRSYYYPLWKFSEFYYLRKTQKCISGSDTTLFWMSIISKVFSPIEF